MQPPVTNRLFLLTVMMAVAALANGSVVVTEIHYKPADKTSPEEFVEIHNRKPVAVNLFGWRFTEGIDFTFPEGTVLEPGGYMVVAENPARLKAVFSVGALGPYSGRLANDGERLVLRDRQGAVADAVEYRNEFPWPVGRGTLVVFRANNTCNGGRGSLPIDAMEA